MLSIITNFGCDEQCPYCIWKGHKFEHVKTTMQGTDWKALEAMISSQSRISVSGGGDPLFQLDKNMDWWNRFFKIVQDVGVPVDLHTAKLAPVSFARNFAKYVWHVKDITKPLASAYTQLVDYGIPIRVVAVGEERYSGHDFIAFAQQVVMMGFQCSIRELVVDGKPFTENKALTMFLETELAWKFVRQADYNKYFMPDNTVCDRFIL
jgi:organic radical activating enzyme